MEAALYRTQIQYLDEELKRYQLQCDRLSQQNQELVQKREALDRDRRDVTEYLTRCCDAAGREAEELLGRLQRQKQDDRREAEALRGQHREAMQELQERVEQLRLETEAQGAALQQQEEQHLLMEQRCASMAALERQAEEQRCASMAALERQAEEQAESRRIQQENQERARRHMEAVERDRKAAEEKAAEEKAMEEVRSLVQEQSGLLRQKEELLSRQAQLQANGRQASGELRRARGAARRLSQEAQRQARRCRLQRAEVEKDRSRLQGALSAEDAVRQQYGRLCEQLHHHTAELCQLEAELQTERHRTSQLEGDMRQIAGVLRRVVEEEVWSKDPQLARRRLQELLQKLLRAPGGPDPQGAESRDRFPRETSSPDRAEGPDFSRLPPLFLMARYRPGDLGILPRRTWKQEGSRRSRRRCSRQYRVSGSRLLTPAEEVGRGRETSK